MRSTVPAAANSMGTKSQATRYRVVPTKTIAITVANPRTISPRAGKVRRVGERMSHRSEVARSRSGHHGAVRRRAVPPSVTKSDEEWRAELTPGQYRVLRERKTERAFTGAHIHPAEDGTFRCAGCGAVLFESGAQFDSGTGWPSFTEPAVADAVALRRDFSLLLPRTEVSCRRCGGHLGHVFRDGPGPDRQRFCINSCALDLDPGPD